MDYESLLRRIISSPAASVQWYGTRRDLVELVAIVAQQKVICDRRGIPLSQNKLARMAFNAVGLRAPSHVSSIVYAIRNRITPMPPLSKRIEANTSQQ